MDTWPVNGECGKLNPEGSLKPPSTGRCWPCWLCFLLSASCFFPLAGAEEQSIAPSADKPHPAPAQGAATPAPPVATAEVGAALERLKASEQAERLAALKELRRLSPQPVPAPVTAELFRATLLDADADVRREAALALKALDDQDGKALLLASVLRPKVTAEVRRRGAEALWRMDDPAVVGYLVRLVTSEIKTGTASLAGPIQTRYISGAVLLPIHLPEIEIIHAEGYTVTFAISALQTIAGRDLGNDPGAWKRWYEDWQKIRAARLKQEGAQP